MTLKNFLKTRVMYYRNAGNQYKDDYYLCWFFHGQARAFQDMLDVFPEELLNSTVPDSVWR